MLMLNIKPFQQKEFIPVSKFEKRCAVKEGETIDLNKVKTDETFGWSRAEAEEQTAKNLVRIGELQELLYAEKKRGLLIVLQAMDTGGKDGTIEVIGGAMNPAGTRVASFKAPTDEEKQHDFLWRIEKQVPKAGEVVIFNRSHYEDVGVVRVHAFVPESVWRPRYDQIKDFEARLAEPTPEVPEGTQVIKFWLQISKDEQWERFRDRVMDPAKNWKFSENDMKEREYWDQYMEAYSEAISTCSTEEAPWIVIPADHKWMRNLIISQIVVDQMEGLNMQFPPPSANIEAVKKKYFSDDKKPEESRKDEKKKHHGKRKSLQQHFKP